jgi:hypothetical protein
MPNASLKIEVRVPRDITSCHTIAPSQAKPSQAKPSQAKPSQAKPSQTKRQRALYE